MSNASHSLLAWLERLTHRMAIHVRIEMTDMQYPDFMEKVVPRMHHSASHTPDPYLHPAQHLTHARKSSVQQHIAAAAYPTDDLPHLGDSTLGLARCGH